MLNDLVRSRLGTSTNDLGVAVSLDGKSVLADIDPPAKFVSFLVLQDAMNFWYLPNVLDGARALAMNALDLVLANDGVLEGAAGLDSEHGVLITTLVLASALHCNPFVSLQLQLYKETD